MFTRIGRILVTSGFQANRMGSDHRQYSRTSDKGPSVIGATSLQRTLVAAPC